MENKTKQISQQYSNRFDVHEYEQFEGFEVLNQHVLERFKFLSLIYVGHFTVALSQTFTFCMYSLQSHFYGIYILLQMCIEISLLQRIT